MERLRDACENNRDLAIIDVLASTGMRIDELVKLNRDDIDFTERECLVLGKGDKERMVYFDARAKLHLKVYLDSRTTTKPCLWASERRATGLRSTESSCGSENLAGRSASRNAIRISSGEQWQRWR